MADVTIRKTSAEAAREIKASAHYAYINNGITLDGSKFALGELVKEGQCLIKDNVTGLYEKYADGAPTPAVVNGAANITAADLAGINAGTTVTVKVNGVAYVIANATLAAVTAVGGEAGVITAVKAAANAQGVTLDQICNVAAVANKLRIATIESGSGQKIEVSGTWGVAGDEATVEGVLGLAIPASDVGTGAFPEGKSNPVILDESVKFELDDLGANPNVTVGQVLVHGAVYNGMLISATDAFKQALAGFIRFV